MATGSSLLLGSFRQPRHTSPKSPVGGDRQTELMIPADRSATAGGGEKGKVLQVGLMVSNVCARKKRRNESGVDRGGGGEGW